MKIGIYVVAVLLALVGLIFFLQGTSVIQSSSSMTGQAQWALIGLLMFVIGAGIVVYNRRRAGN